ncbi:MAG: ABC transporter substrate-binding protein [Holosporaceae bacterium]|jgi:trehalose/maltose transport system substrate-binding protein|nr:ABC transporter substrate-binding protein [Holosporaceae bacterium]
MLSFARLLLVCLLSLCSLGYLDQARAATIKIAYRSKGAELDLLKKAIDEWTKKHRGKHKVEIIILPHSSNECFALYQQWFSAESFDIDVLQMDVVWIGTFKDCLTPLDEKDLEFSNYFDAVSGCMFYDGQLLALPLYVDCGVMYYRKDLLEKYGKLVPKTWEELLETALYIQNEERKDPVKKNKFYGFVFQAKAFEILTCVFAEMIDSFGGAIIKNGRIMVNSQQSINCVKFLINCLQNISSRSVLNYSEEDARGVFQSGNAVFMRNWPYAWALLNSSEVVAGKVGVMPIPPGTKEGKFSGVLGGWFLALSKYSKHSEIAADLIKFLTSKEQQKIRARHSYLPTFKTLYSDPDVLKNNDFFREVYPSLQNAVRRPSVEFGKNYNRASTEIFNTVNTILAESSEVEKYLDRLQKKLQKLLKKTEAHATNDNPKDELYKLQMDLQNMQKLRGLLKKNTTIAESSDPEAKKDDNFNEKKENGWLSGICDKLTIIWKSIWSGNEAKISNKENS